MSSYKIPKSLIKEATKKDKIMSIRLNEETAEMLEKLSIENKINKADVIRIAIKNLCS